MKKLTSISAFIFLNMIIGFSQDWQSKIQIESFQGTGSFGVTNQSSLAVVQGYPAIASYDVIHKNLLYVRANDANGSTWGALQAVRTEGDVGNYCILKVANGNPAICYCRQTSTNSYIEYIRANDATGTSWGTPVVLAVGTNGSVYLGYKFSFNIINGIPAVIYNIGGNSYYLKANDASGNVWGTPNLIGNTGFFDKVELITVNGNPSVTYTLSNTLNFVRSGDANGTVWGTPTILANRPFGIWLGSIAIINGNPAISYADRYPYELYYVRADNANGSTWGARITLETGSSTLGTTSQIMMIGGVPAIYYRYTDYAAGLIKATNADGTSWSAPAYIDPMYSIGNGKFELVNGNPATVNYKNSSTNGYWRATNAAGTTWGSIISFPINATVGVNPSLKVINTKPSVVYVNSNTTTYPLIYSLKYSQSDNENGSTWSNPINISTVIPTGSDFYSSLISANGKPAICYTTNYLFGNVPSLRYVQATNSTGTVWGTPITLDAGTVVANSHAIETVNGNPAIAYINQVFNAGLYTNPLKFIRANNADGSIWSSSLTLDPNSDGILSFGTVNNNPAIAYSTVLSTCDVDGLYRRGLKYIRANDNNGTAWNTPIEIIGLSCSCANACTVFRHIKLKMIDGKPAIVFFADQRIFFVRANDINGASWGIPQILETVSGGLVQYLDFALDGNKPVIVYSSSESGNASQIIYAKKANDAQGDSWAAKEIVVANIGGFPYLSAATLANGNIGFVYHDVSEAFSYFLTTRSSIPSKPTVSVKALLQGCYNTTIQLMNDDLRSKILIPSNEPYMGLAGFTHVGGGGGESITTPSVLDDKGSNSIVDWVFLELRDKNNAATVVATRSALIQRDGDVVDVDGVSAVSFNVAADNYFVSIRHRNHLGTRTASAISLNTTTATSIDFTNSATPSVFYGTNPQKDLGGGKLALWMGNVKQDGVLKYSGLNNDRLPILTKIGGTNITAMANGYFVEDCNMDGSVKYSGLNNDRLPILTNIGGTNITATVVEQL